VARWLQKRGWYVVPSYDYAGDERNKPPRLHGLRVGYSVPDLDVAREGSRKWIEVKTKEKASFTYLTGRLEHGIEHRLLDHYQRVAAITGDECWIAVYEESTQELLCQSLALLGTPRASNMNGRRMAFWPRDAFHHLHTFTAAELAEGAA
jgi:hypothetical protein